MLAAPARPLPGVRRLLLPVLVVACLLLQLAPASSQESTDELRSELTLARERLAELDTEASLAVEAFNEAQVALEQVESDLADTRAEAERLQAEVDRLTAVAADMANQLFRLGPTMQMQAVLASGDPTEAGDKAATLSRITTSRATDLESLGVQREQLAAVRRRLDEQQAQAAQRTQELEERRDDVEQTLAAQQDEVRELKVQVAEAEQRERAERERREREREERRRREAAAAEAAAAEAAAAQAAGAEAAAAEAAAEPASSPPAPSTSSAPEPSAPSAPSGARRSAQVAVDAAVSQVGKPYQWGGSGPDSYDCSGLTSWAWDHAGVYLPHSSGAQYSATSRVPRSDLQPGDLIFFGSPIHHVAMYIGSGDVVEAPYSGQSVRISSSALGRSDIAGYGRP